MGYTHPLAASVAEATKCQPQMGEHSLIANLPPSFSSPMAQQVKTACNAGDTGSILGQEDSLEKEMATHSSILVWEIPRTEKPGRLQSLGLQKSRTRLKRLSSSSNSDMKMLLLLLFSC